MYMYDIFNTDTVGIVDNYMEHQHDEFDCGYVGDDDDYDDSMDGDFDTGMASAGFGTDESYFCFGSEE